MIVIEGIDNLKLAQAFTLRQMLKLELLGMKRHGRSAYVIIKETYGFKGNRQSVLDQLTQWIENAK